MRSLDALRLESIAKQRSVRPCSERPAPQYLDSRLPPRFWNKASPCPMSGCWLWTAALGADGYGLFGTSTGRCGLAHRHAYLVLVGPIAPDRQIDHLCRVRSCVNPLHMEPVEARVNVIRGNTSRLRWERTCSAGHEFTVENTWVSARGQRRCRACARHRAIAAKLGGRR